MWLEGRRIAIVEDDPLMGESLVQSLSLEGADVDWWTTGAEALEGMRRSHPDLVVCDICLPDVSGEALYLDLARHGKVPPFMFVTGHGTVDQAVSLIRAGAGDYLAKPFEMLKFLERASALLHGTTPSAERGALGVSPAMRQVEKILERVAAKTTPVLVLGETGVGKEVCARYLHERGRGHERPFIAVNCAAIPAELMESELFGHEKGAFSGATALHRGYAERARDGTLFLDEIGDMPLAMQAKLLRLIEDRCFTRVGGEQTVRFGANVVCATNSRLEQAVAAGRFRQDLFYRINVVTVSVPPLAQRRDDIPWLMQRFLDRFREEAAQPIHGFSSLAEQAALEHGWPGNVRELRNRVERAVLFATGKTIMPSDLFPERYGQEVESPRPRSLRIARDDAERRQIERVLEETGGQMQEAARLLDVSRTTLWEKMKRLGIVVPDDA